MNTLRAAIVIALLAAVPCFGQAAFQEKPAKPQPVHHSADRTADAVYWVEVGAMAAAWTADTVSTHDFFASTPNGHEAGYLFPGSRSTARVMGAWAAVDVGAAVAGYEWKKHVRNRYLHPLWHAFMLYRIDEHAGAAIHNRALLKQ